MRLALVTGANRGIGFELTQLLVSKEHTVIAACRAPSAELEELATKHPGQIEIADGTDVTDPAATLRLRERIGERPLHLLLLNAGIMLRTGLSAFDDKAVRQQFEVNALGPIRMASLLHGCIPEGGKIALTTSRMGSIGDNDSGGSYGYRMSKAALNAAGKSLAIDLAPSRIAVTILHPGWVKTDMTGGTGHVTPAESAAGLLTRIEELTLETTGRFVHMNGEELPW